MVELVGRGRRQALARHEQPKLGEPLGRVAIADAAEPGDEVPLAGRSVSISKLAEPSSPASGP